MKINQIFLKLYPDKNFEDFPIFVKSKTEFEKIGDYQLICDDEADKLMQQYPEFYEMWTNVRYGIMKVDILRFILLYHYGGIVCDLDVLPLKGEYEYGDKILVYSPESRFNYEVIISKPNDEVFLNFLRYVKEQIEIKNKLEIYDKWKARYVIQTTGPRAFKRFVDMNKTKFEIVNKINQLNDETWKDNDFVTLGCCSWMNLLGIEKPHTPSNIQQQKHILANYRPSYKIVIPSYGRYNAFHTLNLLEEFEDQTYIFITQEEEQLYKNAIGDKFKNLIVAPSGIGATRNFITNYFDEGEILVCLDDDIRWLNRPLKEWLNDAVKHLSQSEFGMMTFPATTMYIKPEIKYTEGMYFGIGVFHIVKNHKHIQLTYNQGEEFERTIAYLKKYGKNIRIHGIAFRTKYFGKGGLENYRTIEVYVNETNRLIYEFKDYLHFKDKVILNQMLGNVKLYRTVKSIDIIQLGYYNCYNKLFNLFEDILFKMKKGSTGRRGFPEYRGAVFGLTRPRFKYKGYLQLSTDSKISPEAYEEIMRIGKIICPFEFNSVQVNKNLVCPPHKDSNNMGLSLLVSFGDYSGCNIMIENKKYDANCRPIIFNGADMEHYNSDDLVGTKYSLVFFTTKNQ
tara:strand:- start:441 stop:2306 length:1866 start_codon:yes stop_codon:yes gene_type:complete